MSNNPVDLEDEYNTLAVQLEEQGLTCTVHGWAGIICSPCPRHKEVKFDAVYLDVTDELTWKCLKDEEVDELPVPDITAEALKSAKGKIKAQHKADYRAELLARKYALSNYVISIKNEDKYAVFVYRPHEGKYDLIGKEIIRGEIQQSHRELFGGEHPTETIARLAFYDLAEWTERKEGMRLFDHDTGESYILPFRDKDVLINRYTGKMEVLDKDPLNRPVNMALPYNFSILSEKESEMPPELKELLTLVPPSYYDAFLFELASPLALHGARRIFINFSRVGATGKTTVLSRISELYKDFVTWTEANVLGERFEKASFLGKSAVLLDEFEGAGLRARREFKTIASGNELRIEIKNGPILNVKNRLALIINTNVLRFYGADDALLSRFIIIPFIRNFTGTIPPKEWDEKTKARITSWLVRKVLPRYFLEEPKRYPVSKIKDWAEKAERGEPPEDGLWDFLRGYFYEDNSTKGVLTSVDEAFKYYLLWTAQVDLIPLSKQEFIDQLEFIANRDGGWLIEKDGEKKLRMRKSGLTFFT